MKNKKVKLIVLIIVAVIVAGGSVYYLTGHTLPWMSSKAEAFTQKEYPVMETAYSTTVDLSGSLEAYDTQSVNFRISGACTEVCVEEGDTVTEGQLIARIDDISYQKTIKEIEANIKKAEITGTTSDLEILQLELEEAENNLEYTKVFAAFDGVVSDSDLEVGDYVEKGTSYLTIIDVSSLKATVEIDEIDMQYIEIGETATLSFDGYPEGDLEATVTYIPMVGKTTTAGIGVMDVELTLENPPELLKIGYTFEGEIAIEGETTILLVPKTAITVDSEEGSTVQKLNEDGSVSTVTITSKYLAEGYSQILSGDLEAGDIVVTISANASEEESSSSLGLSLPGMGTGSGTPPQGDGQRGPQQ